MKKSRRNETGTRELKDRNNRGFNERKSGRGGEGTRERNTGKFGERNTYRDKEIRSDRTREGRELRNDRIRENTEVAVVNEVREDLIEGRNAVIEALKSDRTIESILVAKGDTTGSITKILAIAKEKNLVVKEVDRKKLDSMSSTGVHQGVMAIVTPYKYYEIEDILAYAEEKGEKPFVLILDEIEDPHNLGSIIRTAETCGAHGIIIPKRRNVGITPTVYKTSAGAIEYMRVAKVANVNRAIDTLKERGIWVYGADMAGESYSFQTNFKGAVALVIGSEGRGISKLTKEKCDVLVKIPMAGNITSLNASVAAGILMYEVLKQKME